MQHVLIAGNHIDQVRLRHGFARQGANDIIGLIAGEFEDWDAVRFQRPANIGQLLRQVSRHLATIRLVAAIFDFLEGLSFQIELANLGNGFGLLIAECGRCHVEYRSEIFGRKIFA